MRGKILAHWPSWRLQFTRLFFSSLQPTKDKHIEIYVCSPKNKTGCKTRNGWFPCRYMLSSDVWPRLWFFLRWESLMVQNQPDFHENIHTYHFFMVSSIRTVVSKDPFMFSQSYIIQFLHWLGIKASGNSIADVERRVLKIERRFKCFQLG